MSWIWLILSGAIITCPLLWFNYRGRRLAGKRWLADNWPERFLLLVVVGCFLGWGFFGVLPWRVWAIWHGYPKSLGPPPNLPVQYMPVVAGSVIGIILLRTGFWILERRKAGESPSATRPKIWSMALACVCWFGAVLITGGGWLVFLTLPDRP